jgi:hypothetical protein
LKSEQNELEYEECEYIEITVMRKVMSGKSFTTPLILEEMESQDLEYQDIIKRSIELHETSEGDSYKDFGKRKAIDLIKKRIEGLLDDMRMGGLIITNKVSNQNTHIIDKDFMRLIDIRLDQERMQKIDAYKNDKIGIDDHVVLTRRQQIYQGLNRDIETMGDALAQLAKDKAEGIFNLAKRHSSKIEDVYQEYADFENNTSKNAALILSGKLKKVTTKKIEQSNGEFGEKSAESLNSKGKVYRLSEDDKGLIKDIREDLLDDIRRKQLRFTTKEASLVSSAFKNIYKEIIEAHAADDTEQYKILLKLKSINESIKSFT